jgi:hypothetical protein
MMGDDTIGTEVWPNFALPAGTTINGYRIQRVLGSGGFGITYLATDLLSQRFAIKEYFPRQLAVRQNQQVVAASAEDVAMFNDGRERFLREAKALVLLSRSGENRGGIVRVQTYFESHGTALFVMDYLEGANLASVLRKYPDGLPAERLDSILRQLLASVRIVHRVGLMHRDIKPANIILRDDDTVVLIDFGAIRETTTEQATVYTQIYSGGYAPPEQMTGMPQGEFSDIYAIGAVAYRAIGGKPVNAMARQNAMSGGHADIQSAAERIGAGRYPKKLLAAIDAAQALDPRRRLQTVDAMLAALGSSPAEEPTVIARRVHDSAAGSRRRLILWGAAGVACVAIAIGGGAYLLRSPASISATNQERSPIAQPPVAQQQAVASVPAEAPVQQPPPPVPAAPAPQAAPQVPNQQEPAAAPVEAPLPQSQPRQEALAPPQEPQQPQPEISPLERAQAAAAAVPCAALAVAQAPPGLRVSGFAGPGPEFDRLLADLRNTGNVTNAVTAIDGRVCATITAFAPAIRQGLATAPVTPTIRLNSQRVAEGSVLRMDIEAPSPVLLLDLYQNDGTVRHLRTSNRHAEWIAKGPPGPRLLVAIASPDPLYAGMRPEVENGRDYLTVLQPRLDSTGSSVKANLAIVTVYPAPAAVMRAPQRPAQSSARCANIVSRAQLGETLSDEELAALRTECRS